MKIFLIILCVLAFLLLFALLLKVRFRIKAESEVTLTLEALFLKFRLFPKKEARPDPRKFSKRALEKKIAKERKKALKKQKKASAKNTKKQKQAESPKESRGSLTEKIELVLFLVKKAFAALDSMAANRRGFTGALLGSVFGMLFVFLVEYVWFYPRDMFMFWIILGLLSVSAKEFKTITTPDKQ